MLRILSTRALITCALIVCALMASACSGPRKVGPPDYDTVVAESERNTEAAKRHHREAIALIESGDFDAAELALKRALTQDVMFGPAHNNLGRVYFARERYYLAAWEFQYAVKLMPGRSEPKNNLGLVFEAVGRLDEAVEEYGKALALEPDNPELFGNLARARVRRGDDGKEVRGLLQDIVLKDPRAEWVSWARERLELGRPRAEVEAPR